MHAGACLQNQSNMKIAFSKFNCISHSLINNCCIFCDLGQVTVKFTSLSPVVFIKLTEKADTTSEDTTASDSTASPKTGVNVVYYAELLALVSLARACVCAKRTRR